MPAGRRSARPRPLFAPPVKSLAAARAVTSEFHRLTRVLARARDAGEATEQIEAALAAAGGRAAYQEASQLTTCRHRTAAFVFSVLTRLGLRPSRGEPPLALLEVGAVNLQLSSVPWLTVRAIDIRSTHPRIEQRDFFTLRPRGSFAVVVLAMVLNCVPDAFSRGRMLLGCRAHLRPGGLLLVTIPLRCLTRSAHTTWRSFSAALSVAGFEVAETRESPKVAHLVARAVPDFAAVGDHSTVQTRVRGPGLSNDFAIAFAE
jgi:25S rRNA (adenine2142-N1)-methyltransferase